jgi:hypothetical protein
MRCRLEPADQGSAKICINVEKTMKMKKTINRPVRIAIQAAVPWIAGFLILLASGCAVNVRVGGQKISQEVTHLFESYQVLPDHRYYHIGWDTRPYAIIALQKPYKIVDKLWLEFQADSKTLRKRVDALAVFPERGYWRANGYYLTDKEGNRIGVYYSSISIFSVKVDQSTHIVSVAMDKPWVTGDRFDL